MWSGNDWIDFYVYFDWLNLPTISKKPPILNGSTKEPLYNIINCWN